MELVEMAERLGDFLAKAAISCLQAGPIYVYLYA